MWVKVSDLAGLVNVSSRSIQRYIKDGKVIARRVDGKSQEVDVASIPQEWKALLPAETKKALGLASPINALSVVTESRLSVLGRKLSPSDKKKMEVNAYYKSLDPLLSKGVRTDMTARFFAISERTVARYLSETAEIGVPVQKEREKRKNWSVEAESYLTGWYLDFLRQTGKDSKTAAWKATVAEAKAKGWSIGCKSSAFDILGEIPEIVKKYAIGGNRALDNHFYIARDWSSLKPSQVWIGDQHICDYWVADYSDPEKPYFYRPCLYVWEDGATRMVAGLACDKESYTSQTVLDALKMGIMRFGFFDCTYNDNGTSECAKATVRVIDELMMLSNGKTSMKDVSDLYKGLDGVYTVEDPDGKEVARTSDAKEWHRLHRRIYANVKNAKAKPIERLFGVLEERMAQRGVPGHVVTPGAPADQEEKEQQALDRLKKNRQILTLDAFMAELAKEIDIYEETYHASLKMSPKEKLKEYVDAGWRAVRPLQKDLDFVFLQRTESKVIKGRVKANGITYLGEDLKPIVDGYADVGLHLHEGEKIEVRYDEADPDVCYAVIPNSVNKVRALKPVKAIDMLDDEAMKQGIKWKREQMRVVRDVFDKLTKPEGVKIETPYAKAIEEADKSLKAIPEPKPEEVNVHVPTAQTRKAYASHRDHYMHCLEMIKDKKDLDAEDVSFMERYEKTEEYLQSKTYWDTYKTLEGINHDDERDL